MHLRVDWTYTKPTDDRKTVRWALGMNACGWHFVVFRLVCLRWCQIKTMPFQPVFNTPRMSVEQSFDLTLHNKQECVRLCSSKGTRTVLRVPAYDLTFMPIVSSGNNKWTCECIEDCWGMMISQTSQHNQQKPRERKKSSYMWTIRRNPE